MIDGRDAAGFEILTSALFAGAVAGAEAAPFQISRITYSTNLRNMTIAVTLYAAFHAHNK